MKMYDVYVSELCEGNLSKENIDFTLEQCKAICEQLIEGLSQLENSKICHNDLKPQNILYKKSDQKYEDGSSRILIKIGDFGTAGRSGAGFGMARHLKVTQTFTILVKTMTIVFKNRKATHF